MTTEPGAALVQVQPEEDPRVMELYREGIALLEFAEALDIEMDDDAKAAGDNLLLVKDVLKAIEAKRLDFTRPLNAYVSNINTVFKGFVEPMKAADTVMRQKVGNYQAEQERIRSEQEAINRLRQEASKRDMALNEELSESVNEVEVSVPAQHYRGQVSTTGTAKTKKWEVSDPDQVPREYLMIDAAKVGKVVRAGVPSIPGIHIWEETSVVVRPRMEQVAAPAAKTEATPAPDLPF